MDWIAVVEAAYRLEDDETSWLTGLLSRLLDLDHGLGVVAQVFRATPKGHQLVQVVSHGGPADLEAHVAELTNSFPRDVVTHLRRYGETTSMRGALGALGHEPAFAERIRSLSLPYVDVHYLPIHDGETHTLAISGACPTENARPPHPGRMRRLAAHIGAGFRLRHRLGASGGEGEAIFSTRGRLEHGDGEAQQLRATLTEAVTRRERARGRARKTPDEALELWRGLVDGRWSLVDRIEHDGRRYVVAHRNEPRVRDPRGLTQREARIAESLGRGSTLKEIAYDDGVGESAVAKAAARARAKLGLGSLSELAAFFTPHLRLSAAPFRVGTEQFFSAPIGPHGQLLESLSPAERDVAERAARGESNRRIADARGTSPNTVANQLRRVFSLLEVDSRVELARLLVAGGAGPDSTHGAREDDAT